MKTARLLIVIVAAAALGALLYRWYGPERGPTSPEVAESPAQPEKVPVPKVRHPVPEPVAESGKSAEPLPTLEESDPELREALAGLLPGRPLEDLLVLNNVIARMVLLIDALPRETLPIKNLPVRQAPGDFLVEEGPDGPVISPDNDRRYAPYMRLIEAVDAKVLVAIYLRYYPLFQQAYEDLGYAGRYFNDRLIEVIDHLIEAPGIEPPVRLVQPKVRYLYADPQLESLSAGRKVLIRIGPENAEALKGKLREIKKALIEVELL